MTRTAPRPLALVFDVGGVIVQWQPLELMRRHFPAHAHDEAQARAVMAQVFETFTPEADWGAFDCGLIDSAVLAARIVKRTALPLAQVQALIDAIPDHLEPMPEVVALLERLRAAGRRLALLSNMPSPYADHLEREHRCFDVFEHRAWSGRLGTMKPQRRIFDHVQEQLGVDDASRLLFIDDHAGNIDAARALGWQALHFTSAREVIAVLDSLA
jgi:putative hydrolase of the HAD superfamily